MIGFVEVCLLQHGLHVVPLVQTDNLRIPVTLDVNTEEKLRLTEILHLVHGRQMPFVCIEMSTILAEQQHVIDIECDGNDTAILHSPVDSRISIGSLEAVLH